MYSASWLQGKTISCSHTSVHELHRHGTHLYYSNIYHILNKNWNFKEKISRCSLIRDLKWRIVMCCLGFCLHSLGAFDHLGPSTIRMGLTGCWRRRETLGLRRWYKYLQQEEEAVRVCYTQEQSIISLWRSEKKKLCYLAARSRSSPEKLYDLVILVSPILYLFCTL